MNNSHGLHGKTFVLILLMVIFGPLGDVLLGKGMKRVGAISSWSPAAFAQLFAGAFSSGFIWLGIASLILFFIAYLLVLSWADYSYVQPASASSYVVVALLGALLLGEVITSVRWTGVLTICLGVVLVGGTPPNTTERG
jgi:drug/metabolite transporter (DMT)-like permease